MFKEWNTWARYANEGKSSAATREASQGGHGPMSAMSKEASLKSVVSVGSTLKECSEDPAARHAGEQRADKWATSLAVLYNAVLKLSKVSARAQVFRGVKEDVMKLPDRFFPMPKDRLSSESLTFAGGIEKAFMRWAPRSAEIWLSPRPARPQACASPPLQRSTDSPALPSPAPPVRLSTQRLPSSIRPPRAPTEAPSSKSSSTWRHVAPTFNGSLNFPRSASWCAPSLIPRCPGCFTNTRATIPRLHNRRPSSQDAQDAFTNTRATIPRLHNRPIDGWWRGPCHVLGAEAHANLRTMPWLMRRTY